MPFQTTPSLGIELEYRGGKPYYDGNSPTPTPALGSKVTGNDGHEYIFVQASANVAADTAVVITEPAMTAAGGAGPFKTQVGGAVTSGQFFWARSAALT